jgi:hypothetical protein
LPAGLIFGKKFCIIKPWGIGSKQQFTWNTSLHQSKSQKYPLNNKKRVEITGKKT